MKFATAIVLSAVMATGLLFAMTSIQSADAVKSSGTKNQQYGKSAEIRVCGTYFCKSSPSMNLQIDSKKNQPTQDDLNALLKRMDKIHKQHLQQISEKWQLLSNTEKAQFIESMNQMMLKMESVDMMSHMEMMLSDQHDRAHTKMKQDVHDKKSGPMEKQNSNVKSE